KATLTSTTNTTICTNQLPYTWNGQSLNTAGTYTANLISAAGCDSIATLNLTVKATLTSTTNTTICTNQLPYTWNGQSLNAAGTYTANLTSAAGCDSIATLNLTVKATLTSTTNTTICANQLPYTWNGQSLNATGTYTANLTSAAGCDSVAALNLTVNTGARTTENISTCQPSYTLPSGIIVSTSGTYTSVLKTISGCDSVITTNLKIFPAPNLVVTDPPTTCSPAAIDLTAAAITAGSSAGLTYTYWQDAACTIAVGNPAAIKTSGTYYIKAANAGGCFLMKPVNVAITSTPSLVINNPATACMPSSIDLTAPSITAGSDPGMTYTYWQDPACTIALGNPAAITTGGTYYIKASAVGGCFTIRPVKATFNQLPTAAFNGNQSICPGVNTSLPVTFTGQAPWTLTYSDGSNTYTIANILTPNYDLIVAPVATTIYTIQSVSDAACSNNSIGSTATVDVKPSIPGIRYPTVDAFAFVPTPLSARSPGSNYSYSWSPAIGLDLPNIQDPMFTFGTSVQYKITLISDSGCVTVDTILVRIINPNDTSLTPDLWVPKAWTPNKDGVNDRLYPITYHIRQLKYFRIFDRWGQLMFETNILHNGWDGMYKGQKQVMDVYTWTVEAIGDDGSVIKKSGNSILLR
ncbi:gliding motility-associated C-terminal domain-containing protein, partial [Flavitalea sp. BT771]|uniref:T9SS type B sorting domain-containing protein n=1 Tax=Flavitalea sp. BT771 TaxID=3063329 RepID=UPI0029497990